MRVQLLFFAKFRDQLGIDSTECELPFSEGTIADLITYLTTLGPSWAETLGGRQIYRVAQNQEMANFNMPLREGAEIAIFPPVTGG
ncbi:molybdopterin converting factor subunit 1 [Burkholderiaceae bacterium DAT-1]|nr:molybdopterin converting factor subunit 1 [Burkholderiaceae bacterium DAT-1]